MRVWPAAGRARKGDGDGWTNEQVLPNLKSKQLTSPSTSCLHPVSPAVQIGTVKPMGWFRRRSGSVSKNASNFNLSGK